MKDIESDRKGPVIEGVHLDELQSSLDNEDKDFYLEEFGKLSLNYFPDKVQVFSGLAGTTYVLMSVEKDLVVFVIQSVVKPNRQSETLTTLNNAAQPTMNLQTCQLLQGRTAQIPQQKTLIDYGGESVENFKMARRCTIPMPYSQPNLIESFADYFIVGGYQ